MLTIFTLFAQMKAFLAGLKRNRLAYEKAFRAEVTDPDANQGQTRREELSIRLFGLPIRRSGWNFHTSCFSVP